MPIANEQIRNEIYDVRDGIEFPRPIDGFPRFGHVLLDNMHNTRDLGGIPTQDGRRIRSNKLVRSGEMHHITERDAVNVLGNHNVRCVVDLRTHTEFDHAPDDPIVYECTEYHHLPVFGGSAIGITHAQGIWDNIEALFAAATNLKATVEGSYDDAMFGKMGISAYREFVMLVAKYAECDGAVLWHCSAGKDRTGIGAILVEHILGVSEENIRKDYLATNIFSYERNQKIPYSLAPVLRDLTGIDVSPMFYVYNAYYEFVMERICKMYGSLDGYIHEVLKITDEIIKDIRKGYLV